MKNHKMHGYGILKYKGEMIHEGSWYEDKQEGCTEVQKWIFIFIFKYLNYIFNIEKFFWYKGIEIKEWKLLKCLYITK